jgi:hypothetical protein
LSPARLRGASPNRLSSFDGSKFQTGFYRNFPGGFANNLEAPHEGAFEHFITQERFLRGFPGLCPKKVGFPQNVAPRGNLVPVAKGRNNALPVGGLCGIVAGSKGIYIWIYI